jgi:threonyl-tRNA synthetase
VQLEDQEALEKLASTIIKEKQPFERLEMTKTDILEMFKYSKFKVHFINERVPDGSTSTVYRCGSFIDFCRGPHVRHTGITKAFSVLRVSLSSSLLAFCEGTSVFLELIRILARRQ